MIKRIIVGFILISCIACSEEYTPKPLGYYRIDLPEKNYTKIDSLDLPLVFEIPEYANLSLKRSQTDKGFFNVDLPRFGARIHFSYLKLEGNMEEILEDSRTLVYKHVAKAHDIGESLIYDEERRVFGQYYLIEGNAASGTQFFVTDSSQHFLRGALYFNVIPNYDSIAPVQSFIREDIEHIIESFRWK